MRSIVAAAACLILAGCASHPPAATVPANLVLAGTVGQIMRGQTVAGRLSLSDARLPDNSVYQAWTLVGRRGERVQVDVMSSDFDAYLILQDAAGVKLATDDDSGGGTNARLIFTLPADGAYRIIATYHQGSFGAYTLFVR
jgi:hypothetical protein